MSSKIVTPLRSAISYGIGEGPNSLVTNGVSTFGLLYYTEILHISPAIAGSALSLSIFWEAFTEPVMGYVSDQTRSRFGSRLPWIVVGGGLIALAMYLFWHIPSRFTGNSTAIIVYLIAVNIALRTGLTMYFIPYLALGFELSPSYDGRSRLQSFRWVFNMLANFLGPALAWSIFFRGHTSATGVRVDGTAVAENYAAMSSAFAIAILVMIALLALSTYRDGRFAAQPKPERKARLWSEFGQALQDRNMRWLLGFALLVQIALMTVVALQTYAYIFVMDLDSWQRSLANGATMVGMASGAFASTYLCRWLDKKPVVMIGVVGGIMSHALFGILYLTGVIHSGTTTGFVTFVLLHGGYWMGSGFIFPVVTAMIGDSAELRSARSPGRHEGVYSAALSLSMRIAFAIGLLVGGWLLSNVGFQPGAAVQMSVEAKRQLAVLLFFVTPAIALLGLPALLRHPVNRQSFEASTC
ncbi:MFS transporter [Sphingomonas sp. PAMC 26605]|uniref:MFS transporter n=1 Tax=Sphingomonas sp. PAMC 26605 TaxID=1112214 RepID=UPI00026CABAA|nr:MFS transporter [Sphingomonas sp. PAMC 26605]